MPDNVVIILPKYHMRGFRVLRSKEEVEEGDFRWSHIKKMYEPVTKNSIGEIAGSTHTFVRKEKNMARPFPAPKGYRLLESKEKIRRGDKFWAVGTKQYLPVVGSIIGLEAGRICTAIRRV